jgi:DeoR/GlpR family transcriptional regulator of sugar metabolism
MYSNLVENKPKYRELARQFANVVHKFEEYVVNPRLLVDAGSTTFHCLFHDDCRRLRQKAVSVLTNNLFVALRWQEEFNNCAEVRLIGGVLNLDTAATVDNEKLTQWLRAASRRPELSLLSWHYIVPGDGGSVKMYTKDRLESEMKHAIMTLTSDVIYVVWSREKNVSEAPKGGKPYDLNELLRDQEKKENQKRRIYMITDIDEKPSDIDTRLIANLKQEKFLKNRVELICPAVKT